MNKKMILQIVALIILVGLAIVVVKKPTTPPPSANGADANTQMPAAVPGGDNAGGSVDDGSGDAVPDDGSQQAFSGEVYAYLSSVESSSGQNYLIFDPITVAADGSISNTATDLSGAPIDASAQVTVSGNTVTVDMLKALLAAPDQSGLQKEPFLVTITSGSVTEVSQGATTH